MAVKRPTKLTRAEVARMLRISRTSVARLVERGILTIEEIDGVTYFDKNEVIDAKEMGAFNGEAEEEQTIRDSMNKLVEMSLDHSSKSAKLYFEPSQAILEIFKAENQSLRERCRELEKTHSELISARESALNEQAIRDSVLREEQAAIERKKDITNTFKTALPPLIRQVIESFGDKRSGALIGLLQRPETVTKLRMMLATDILDDHEKAVIASLLPEPISEKPDTEKGPTDDPLENAAEEIHSPGE
jgi:hypothetical protein